GEPWHRRHPGRTSRCSRRAAMTNLRQRGHEVVAASPSSGVNTVTGEGLGQALAGAQVVVDVANAPSWEDNAVLAFFETSGRNLLAAESSAGVCPRSRSGPALTPPLLGLAALLVLSATAWAQSPVEKYRDLKFPPSEENFDRGWKQRAALEQEIIDSADL